MFKLDSHRYEFLGHHQQTQFWTHFRCISLPKPVNKTDASLSREDKGKESLWQLYLLQAEEEGLLKSHLVRAGAALAFVTAAEAAGAEQDTAL